MSRTGVVAALSALAAVGVMIALSGWRGPSPSLSRVVAHLQRRGEAGGDATAPEPVPRRLRPVVDLVRRQPRAIPSPAQLELVGRSVERHVSWLVVAALVGLVGPPAAVGLLQVGGLVGVAWYIPVVAALAGAAIGPLIVHASTVERAASVRTDLRFQVSAFLDVVTMLLAGNTGYEGALEQAAHAGDGRLFVEVRRRMRESAAVGASLTDALHRTGRDLGLDELEQVAASAALSAAEGAPVARTLAAKCATLRSALAAEQESEARLRTSRLTTPVVGMALVFMGLVIYPALTFS